jgi:enamine deaminase RidA (YjgF/YER057c/UK114 family)
MPKKQAYFPGEDVRGGPYSPALAVGDQVFIAGQGPISPDTQNKLRATPSKNRLN